MLNNVGRRRSGKGLTLLAFVLSPIAFLAAVWLPGAFGSTAASALVAGPPVAQCNDVANVGATTTTCVVTITNNITYNADGTATTASTIVTSVNGVVDSTTSTSPVTEIHQCNDSAKGGASTLTCTATITNNITGAPASAAATSTVDQCDPVNGAPTTSCTTTPAGPNATGGLQAIQQCNRSGATGTVTCTATTSTATDAAPAVTIDQCNGAGTTGASTVTCTATITDTFACTGTSTTLANGACSVATSSSTALPSTSTTGATTSTTAATTSTTGGTTSTTGGTTSTTGGTTSTTGGTTSTTSGTGGTPEGATTLVSSANPSQVDQPVRFLATLPVGSPPGATVSFFDGSTLLGATPMAGDTATFNTSGMAAGEHVITARFDWASGASTSTEMNQTVRASTPAATPTGADTATATGTQTATPTGIQTATPTGLRTATQTVTKTATPTATKTATSTSTSLPRTGAGNLLPALALGLLLVTAGTALRTAGRVRR